MNPTILFIGSGHLAKYLTRNYDNDLKKLFATYRTKKSPLIDKNNQAYFSSPGPLPDSLQNCSVMIWQLPPHQDYATCLELNHHIVNPEAHWIFISSTSVYATGEVSEKSEYSGTSSNAKILIEAEKKLKTFNRKITIIRPGGLIDEERSPLNYFAKTKEIKNSNNKINIIHTDDLARFIWFCINNKLYDQDYNLVSSYHPTKQQYYGELLKNKLNIEAKLDYQSSDHKIVSNTKVLKTGFVIEKMRPLFD